MITAALFTFLLSAAPAGSPARSPKGSAVSLVSDQLQAEVVRALVAKHGAEAEPRAKRGVRQAALLFRPTDGDFKALALEHFIADEATLEQTYLRLEQAFEQLDGHLNEIGRELRRRTDLDLEPMTPVDPLISSLDVGAHLTEDLFENKTAFAVLLNFPVTTLAERLQHADSYSRDDWAKLRLASRFARRVPPEVAQGVAKAGAEADLFIAQYNLWMHHVLTPEGARPFPLGMRLISHWNLRDELKAAYADPKGLERQRIIVKVMERIVTQTIPAAVIDNPRVDWEPFSNKVTAAPTAEVEEGGVKVAPPVSDAPEKDVRYVRLLAQFKAARAADPFSPATPTQIARSFELTREIPEDRVKALLLAVLQSPLVPQVAAEIEKRLGRKLEPQDLWFDGFKVKGRPREELDAITRKKYPDADAYARDMPRLLEQLGFTKEKAKFLADRIRVDPSRGAGHAMGAYRRGDFPRLRTRIEKGGMDYKGYNIAVHEMGHNVEQVFSLYGVDHTLLTGVPNNAFTEALAFVFQARDLELLGLSKPDPEAERMRVLKDFWSTWEIAGVALVDLAVWHWLYQHPNATAAELKVATGQISREVWNEHYAPVLGQRDSMLLGIYSHMIAYPLYLADYPLGHLIAFQIEEKLATSKAFGAEFERMATQGAVAPDVWMKGATGAPISAEPLLRATARALGK